MARLVLRGFRHDFGPGTGNLTVDVPTGAACNWHEGNGEWYVHPSQVPLFAQHDATYRGIPVPLDNLSGDVK